MGELLEDPDGAPYPEEVQTLWSRLDFDEGQEDLRHDLIAALESVAGQRETPPIEHLCWDGHVKDGVREGCCEKQWLDGEDFVEKIMEEKS